MCFLFVCFFSYLKSLFYCPPLNKLFLGALFCFINFKRFLEKKAFKEFCLFVCLQTFESLLVGLEIILSRKS